MAQIFFRQQPKAHDPFMACPRFIGIAWHVWGNVWCTPTDWAVLRRRRYEATWREIEQMTVLFWSVDLGTQNPMVGRRSIDHFHKNGQFNLQPLYQALLTWCKLNQVPKHSWNPIQLEHHRRPQQQQQQRYNKKTNNFNNDNEHTTLKAWKILKRTGRLFLTNAVRVMCRV